MFQWFTVWYSITPLTQNWNTRYQNLFLFVRKQDTQVRSDLITEEDQLDLYLFPSGFFLISGLVLLLKHFCHSWSPPVLLLQRFLPLQLSQTLLGFLVNAGAGQVQVQDGGRPGNEWGHTVTLSHYHTVTLLSLCDTQHSHTVTINQLFVLFCKKMFKIQKLSKFIVYCLLFSFWKLYV